MNKLSLTLFSLLLICLPHSIKANKALENDDNTRYLVGAVPEIDGKVVFTKEFKIPGMNQKDIYDHLITWMDKRLKKNQNPNSRVVYSNENDGSIAGIGEEWIIFKSSVLSLDRTQINYQLTAFAKPESCTLKIEKIRFTYREKEKYTAEEWITDKFALNKSKTKLVNGLAKWRKKTVDFTDETFNQVAKALGESINQIEEPVKVVKPVVNQTGPIIIETSAKSNTVAMTPLVPATSIAKDSKDMIGYSEANLKQIPGEVFALMGNSKLVLSIGKDQFNMTTMTANAGGAIGYQSGKTVAYASLSPEQPFDAIEKAENYTIKLFTEGDNQPKAIIECKKLPAQGAQAGQARTYVGEIIKLLIRK